MHCASMQLARILADVTLLSRSASAVRLPNLSAAQPFVARDVYDGDSTRHSAAGTPNGVAQRLVLLVLHARRCVHLRLFRRHHHHPTTRLDNPAIAKRIWVRTDSGPYRGPGRLHLRLAAGQS
ncbi:hypothetical protein EXIGLDRAFT_460830 [Exidia glandulosa HHB12029]|uniref:Uncharacterized protein n=1 Tax=Exidia glandulosa HHB12029 TaxID=1314781 RepID=A0A165B1R9_EXIGL|nr:hypothetical protein EXIGLDRAFT_460830 [Exidia glandulosa HHB12029]